tara:strand:- start:1356 stop:2072 length:717 start_codon:yes stop_codon:yes gene_type:complete
MEQKAYDQGWRPQEDFSGPEDNWKTAKEYVKDGEWLAKIKESNQRVERLEASFNERLENSNRLNEAKNKADIAALKQAQRDAVDDADTNAYDNATKSIERIESDAEKAKPVEQAQVNPEIAAWEDANPWINDASDERSSIAQALFNSYGNQNKSATVEQALAHVDSKIGVLYPTNNKNPRREQPNTTETGRKPAQRKGKDLSMGDLTNEERQQWQMFGSSMYKTEKEFLQAVKDTRVK